MDNSAGSQLAAAGNVSAAVLANVAPDSDPTPLFVKEREAEFLSCGKQKEKFGNLIY